MTNFLSSFELFLGFCLLLVFYLLLLHRKGNYKDRKFPPGPTPYPIVGNLFQLSGMLKGSITCQLRILEKKYGPILGCTLGSQRFVLLSSAKLGKELFSDEKANGRFRNAVLDELSGGNFGIIQSEGSVWSEQRRFTFRTLRNLGFAKHSMESRILEQVSGFLNSLKETKGHPIPVKGCFSRPALNMIFEIVSGEKNNPHAIQIAHETSEVMGRVAFHQLVALPVLRFIIPEWTGWSHLVRATKIFKNMISETILRRAVSLDDSEPEPGDFISHYLQKMTKETDHSSSFFNENGRKNLVQVIADLFVAGTDSTSTMLEYFMLYLTQNKQIQRNVQEEIDNVIGQNCQPSLSNRRSMPYTEAVILETLRVSSFVPLPSAHKMLEDMEFHGYYLPKGTIVVLDEQNINWDPERWGGDARVFRPERHLTENNTKFNVPDDMITFGFGKRQCPGEAVAMDILFLFLTSILQSFDLEMDPNSENVDFSSTYGILCSPKPFNVIATSRGNTFSTS